MPLAEYTNLYEVQLDLYVARRKRMHAIFDPAGVPVYHAPLVIQVLDWLADKDVTMARFTDDERTYHVEFRCCVHDNPNPGE